MSYRNAIDAAMYEDIEFDFDSNPIFDKADYKTKDKVPVKVRRLMQKMPGTRTSREVHYVSTAEPRYIKFPNLISKFKKFLT